MTNSVEGQAAQTRTYGFTPDANHSLCRLQQRIVEPSSASQNVTETLTYDSCGNVSQVDTAGRNSDGSALSTRTTKFDYNRLTAIVTRNSDSTTTTTYALSDHLGSSEALIDGTAGRVGNLLVRESFAPFGQRRASNWAAGTPSPAEWQAISKATRRGFTFHETLDNLGLIHMNGRVYDPMVGRFLSVDPVIGDLADSQSVNPYAYVGNRPLSFVDPTGWEVLETVDVFGKRDDKIFAEAGAFVKETFKKIGGLFSHTKGPPPPTVAATNVSAQASVGVAPSEKPLMATVPIPASGYSEKDWYYPDANYSPHSQR